MRAPGRALVTGAGGRIGRALALRLASRGHAVAVHYQGSAEGAEETARLARDMGVGAATLQADLLDPEATSALVGRAAEALGGPLTVLVNSASIFDRDSVADATADSFRRHMGIHALAPMLLTQRFAAQAPEPGADPEPVARAMVVNVIDQRVLKLTPEFLTYTLSKAALWTLTQTTARALAPRVRVNAIAPGPTLKAPRQTEAHFAAQRRGTVMGRGSDPDDLAGALDYLLGARAVTGTLLPVDGGQHLGWRTPDVIG